MPLCGTNRYTSEKVHLLYMMHQIDRRNYPFIIDHFGFSVQLLHLRIGRCTHSFYCRSVARAKVKTSTSAALFFKRILAHSFTVEPVVKTSSTRRIFLFFIFSGFFILKAFLTFLLRAAPFKPVWGRVHWCRSNTWGTILSLISGNNFLQSTRAWLKPLLRNRFG